MKKLIFIGGPMGVGKTTAARALLNMCENSIWYDGDFAWEQGANYENWDYSDKCKALTLDTICYTLNNHLENPNKQVVIFSWVLHLTETKETILNYLKKNGKERGRHFEFYDFSLIVEDAEILKNRLHKRALSDRDASPEDFVAEHFTNSVDRLKRHKTLNTIKIDASSNNPRIAAAKIKEHVFGKN